ncbi:MAG: hypothetical protein RL595_191, partial [Planctomycetota bacterium]
FLAHMLGGLKYAMGVSGSDGK